MKAKKATCAAALASALSLLAAVPNVSDVSFVQDPDTRRVTIGYQIDVPAVVTVDVQTNRGDGTFVTAWATNAPTDNWANLGYRLCAPAIAPHKTK